MDCLRANPPETTCRSSPLELIAHCLAASWKGAGIKCVSSSAHVVDSCRTWQTQTQRALLNWICRICHGCFLCRAWKRLHVFHLLDVFRIQRFTATERRFRRYTELRSEISE